MFFYCLVKIFFENISNISCNVLVILKARASHDLGGKVTWSLTHSVTDYVADIYPLSPCQVLKDPEVFRKALKGPEGFQNVLRYMV